MIARTLVVSTAAVIFGILQSTLLPKIVPLNIVPDIALIILVASSWRYGSLVGAMSGFIIGLGMDAMSLAPLGFHSFLLTLIGYLFGRMQDNIAPGSVFLPVLAALIATLLKYSGAFLLSLIFGLNSGAVRYFSLNSLWELLVNMLLAPFVFLLVAAMARLSEGRRGGFH